MTCVTDATKANYAQMFPSFSFFIISISIKKIELSISWLQQQQQSPAIKIINKNYRNHILWIKSTNLHNKVNICCCFWKHSHWKYSELTCIALLKVVDYQRFIDHCVSIPTAARILKLNGLNWKWWFYTWVIKSKFNIKLNCWCQIKLSKWMFI